MLQKGKIEVQGGKGRDNKSFALGKFGTLRSARTPLLLRGVTIWKVEKMARGAGTEERQNGFVFRVKRLVCEKLTEQRGGGKRKRGGIGKN